MKKFFVIIISMVLICLALSSCKVKKDCPAYGCADTKVEYKA